MPSLDALLILALLLVNLVGYALVVHESDQRNRDDRNR